MIEYSRHEKEYLSVCKHYRHIYSTPSVESDASLWKPVLQCAAVYVVLAPFDNEQSDLLHRISADKKLEDVPLYRYEKRPFLLSSLLTGHLRVFSELLRTFTTRELIDWPQFEARFRGDIFGNARLAAQDPAAIWSVMHERVVEHVRAASRS